MSRDLPEPRGGPQQRVGPLVLGTMMFGTQVDDVTSERMIHRARELGVSMFDTANTYGDGRSEEILGKAVRPFRDEIQIATKVGSARAAEDPSAPRLDRTSILRACNESLSRLGTDVIDLYYLHMPDPATPLSESLAACQELLDAGKIRHLGFSNFAAWQLAHASHLGALNGWPQVGVSQPMYNLLARRIEEEYVAFSQAFGISNLVFNPLAGGLLSGRYRLHKGAPPEGTRFSWRPNYVDRYWNDQQLQAVARLQQVADDAGLTFIQLALRWLLSRPWVAGVLIGVSSMAHLETNIEAADGASPDSDVLEAIDEVWRDLRGPAPSYSR
jgi:aryl-alcohol dehydrogenase-like predicted oxidoreductase